MSNTQQQQQPQQEPKPVQLYVRPALWGKVKEVAKVEHRLLSPQASILLELGLEAWEAQKKQQKAALA